MNACLALFEMESWPHEPLRISRVVLLHRRFTAAGPNRPHHRQALRHAFRSRRSPRHGLHQRPACDPGWARCSEAWRQRRGRRHRGQCHARIDGAGLERNRRRSLRHRLQREGKQALRLERQRPLAAWTELRTDESRARQVAPHNNSAARHATHQCARSGRCMERVA